MKKSFYILISLTLLLFVGCNSNRKTNIPDLKVSVDGAEILVSRCGYEWTNNVGFSKKETVTADSASPEQIADTMSGNKVKPKSELLLSFSEKPKNVEIIAWGESKENKYTYDNDKLIVPQEKGTYIYEVFGEWTQGHVSYTIKVIVTNE